MSGSSIVQLHSFERRPTRAFLSRHRTWGCHRGMVYLRSAPNPQLSGLASAPICRAQSLYTGCYYHHPCRDRRFHYTNPRSLAQCCISLIYSGAERATCISVISHGTGCFSTVHGTLQVVLFYLQSLLLGPASCPGPSVIPPPETAVKEGHAGHVMSKPPQWVTGPFSRQPGSCQSSTVRYAASSTLGPIIP